MQLFVYQQQERGYNIWKFK